MKNSSDLLVSKQSRIKKLKIPINVSVMSDYKKLFEYVNRMGFVPEPYLSSSKYSIRGGQDNPENFMKHMETFLKYKREFDILPGFVHIVYNTRNANQEIIDNIDSTLQDLLSVGYDLKEVNLIISHPYLVNYYLSKGVNVTVSSASILSYKRIIDILIKCSIPISSHVSYVLPSTYHFCIKDLPPNSFELMVNNGCMLGCINATVTTDHEKFCPIKDNKLSSLYYDEFQKRTDLIHKWKFRKLVEDGWCSFKIAGRQAPVSKIIETVYYYLNDDEKNIPWIDNPIFFGQCSNG